MTILEAEEVSSGAQCPHIYSSTTIGALPGYHLSFHVVNHCTVYTMPFQPVLQVSANRIGIEGHLRGWFSHLRDASRIFRVISRICWIIGAICQPEGIDVFAPFTFLAV